MSVRPVELKGSASTFPECLAKLPWTICGLEQEFLNMRQYSRKMSTLHFLCVEAEYAAHGTVIGLYRPELSPVARALVTMKA